MCTCILHLELIQRNLLQVRISRAILEGQSVAGALIIKFVFGPPTIADDGGVNKVCCVKVGLLPKPITKDIVWAGFESRFV